MKQVNLREFPEFWSDFRSRVIEINQELDLADGYKIFNGWYSGSTKFIKDWYGFTVEMDRSGSLGAVFMSDQDYTLFALKYGK